MVEKIWILSKNIFGESLTKCAPSGHEKAIINRKSREPFFKYGSLRLNDLSNRPVTAVLDSLAQAKKTKHVQACRRRRADFTPFIVTTDGVIQREGQHFLKRLAYPASRTSVPRTTAPPRPLSAHSCHWQSWEQQATVSVAPVRRCCPFGLKDGAVMSLSLD